MVSMNRLSTEKRAQVIGCLVEGMSIRATVRLTGAAKNTVTKLLVDVGQACSDYQDRTLRGLSCKRIECDEIWSFVGAKQKHVGPEHPADYGDWWTWTAIDADTKLVPAWYVGARTATDAVEFMTDLAERLDNRVQLTTDGLNSYLIGVDRAFEGGIDYAMLVKIYGQDPEPQRRYSPAVCTGTERTVITGDPDPAHISTSYVERQNLTMRMSMRRFTRLTNAFSKRVENLAAAVSLHFMHYNFARPHKSLSKPYPTTPAMAAGVADHVWTLEEIAGLLDQPADAQTA
jgi:IS1 family transposase